MVPDTRYLHSFYAVCTHGGVGRAARSLFRSQPAVSYQLARLERELGTPLFERGGRRLILTPAGHGLLEFCRRYFAEYETLRAQMAQGTPAVREPLRIAAVSGFGRYVLFPVLCQERFREVRLDLRFRTAAEVFRLVESGECDLGIVYHTRVSSHLVFRALYEEEIALIAAPELALRETELDRLERMEGVPFVTYLEGDYVFGQWFYTFFGAQPGRVTSVQHFDELEEVVAMVERGRGASIVPLDSAQAAAERGAVEVLRPGGRRCTNQVYSVTRAGAFPRPEVEAIVEAVSAPHAGDA